MHLAASSSKTRKILQWIIPPLAVICLAVWRWMPIYPDEIAFRQQLGRALVDKWTIYGLYAACPSNFKTVPWLLTPAAWIVSWLTDTFSPAETRIVPFVSVLGVVILAARYAANGRNPIAAVLTLASFVGVAGSGLILARYEYPLEINLLCAVMIAIYLESRARNELGSWCLAAALLFSASLSLYAHAQGLLFLPLNVFLTYCLLVCHTARWSATALTTFVYTAMAVGSLNFQHLACTEHPGVEAMWQSMVFKTNDLNPSAIMPWITTKIELFGTNFLYKEHYPIAYLPGLSPASFSAEVAMRTLDLTILFVVNTMLLLSLAVVAIAPIVTIVHLYHGRPTKITATPTDPICGSLASAWLLLAPMICLFLYDSRQAFYRDFLLNQIASIGLAMLLSRLPLARQRPLIIGYSVFAGIAALGSLAANAEWIAGDLAAGYGGPSLALNRDWNVIASDVRDLANECHMDLSKGRIIVDDATYDSLKLYSHTYPITYLGLQAAMSKTTVADLLRTIQPNYAITFCATMRPTGLVPQHQQGELCCANLTGR